MTSPPEQIVILCPSCGQEFETWWRPSINLQLDDFDKEYLHEASVKACPHCETEVRLATLVVDRDGVWHLGERDDGSNAR